MGATIGAGLELGRLDRLSSSEMDATNKPDTNTEPDSAMDTMEHDDIFV